jgi:hypothetical protein
MDRRRHTRSAGREEAFIRDETGRTVPVIVHDTSVKGARITVPAGEILPDIVELVLPKDNRTHACGVVWHVGSTYGLVKLAPGATDAVLELAAASAPGADGVIKARYRG